MILPSVVRKNISSAALVCVLSVTTRAAEGWFVRTVDFGGSVGEYAALALDARDEPHIAYYNWSNSSLRCAMPSDDSSVKFHNVDVAGNSGKAAAIAVGSDGPHISYIDTRSKSLKYARLKNDKWHTETVDSPADCERTSITLDKNGRPHISYSGGRTRALKIATPSETLDGWRIDPVDKDRCGHYSSIDIDSRGFPHVAYWDGAASVLKYARKTEDGWKTTIVDKDGDVGQCCSMKLDTSGKPHIAYYDFTLKNLKYARFDGSRWLVRTVDADGDVGGYCSLAMSKDKPAISYWDYSNMSLKYARFDGKSWEKFTVDAGDVGGWTSLATDSFGTPHIAYYDYKNKDLKLASMRNPATALAARRKNPPVLKISSVTFTDEDGDGILSAGENGIFAVTVDNTGEGPALGVRPAIRIIEASGGEFAFAFSQKASIKPGDRLQTRAAVTAGSTLKDGRAAFELTAVEDAGFDSQKVLLNVLTEAHRPPELTIYSVGFKELAFVEKNGQIDPGEAIELTIGVHNKGPGRARGVKVGMSAASPDIFITSDKEINAGNMAAGEKKKFSFTFTLSRRYRGAPELPISIAVEEKRPQYSLARNPGLMLGRKSQETAKIFFSGTAGREAVRDEVYERIPEKARRVSSDAVAVVAAVGAYRHADVPAVDYAINDAALMKEYLLKVLGYREGNIIVLENPTKGDFERVFGTVNDAKGQLHASIKSGKSNVFVYYTGHGAPDAQTRDAYIVPSDCHPNFVRLGGYSLDLLCDNLARLPAASVTLVTDACYSGGFHLGTLVTKGSPLAVTPARTPHDGRLSILTSSSDDEISSWYPEKQHGLFTYYFAMALSGMADADADGNITLGEIKDYLDENVSYHARKLFNRAQTPVLYGDRNRILVYR